MIGWLMNLLRGGPSRRAKERTELKQRATQGIEHATKVVAESREDRRRRALQLEVEIRRRSR